jgi:catechol 2,3-dioxygenase-like lactoylglutathione lyase family enzyme
MLGTAELIAFAATADLDRAKDFYLGVLGLRAVEDTPYACVIDAAGTMLRLVPVGPPGSVLVAPYTVLGWKVPDIDATVKELAARGVEFTRYDGMDQDEAGVWTAPGGDRVAWFRDPDGNTLSLTQFVAAV